MTIQLLSINLKIQLINLSSSAGLILYFIKSAYKGYYLFLKRNNNGAADGEGKDYISFKMLYLII